MGPMRAKDLADIAGTTVRTIRYYHQLGLLSVPEQGTTWRSYGFAHLTRLMRIRWLVESGIPLVEVPHLLRPSVAGDEYTLVVDDLAAVLASIDQKLAVLREQRAQVQLMLERVQEHGRLSPLPPSLVRMYAALMQRPLPPGMVQAMTAERDLVELACYRNALPDDVVAIVDAMGDDDIEQLCGLWEECHRIDEAVCVAGLTDPLRARIQRVVRDVIALCDRVEPQTTARLLDRAQELDRPVVRAAVDLAYPSAAYRAFLRCLTAVAKQRSAA